MCTPEFFIDHGKRLQPKPIPKPNEIHSFTVNEKGQEQN